MLTVTEWHYSEVYGSVKSLVNAFAPLRLCVKSSLLMAELHRFCREVILREHIGLLPGGKATWIA